ncbi:MAG: DUF190 domain-containing protein [Candidatus Caenarcaniphilales bacterium]|nr:DUF190 domain-containing protein [Candidatus Caenarcaniphilales bacterium]
MEQLHYDGESTSIPLNKMLKVEVIVSGENQELVTGMMQDSGVTGYTIINNVSGYGHGGSHEARLLFNDKANLIMIVAVAPESVITNIAKGLKTLLEGQSGVMFVSEVSVARLTYFS